MKKYTAVFLIGCILSLSLVSFAQLPVGRTAGEALRSYGLITGDGKGNLNENAYLTRAEMAVLIATMRGEKQVAMNFKLKSTFTDVNAKEWYAPYVAYLEAMGLSEGIGGGKFAPHAFVSSNEAAAFLLNILDIPYSYVNAMETAKEIGIKNGLETRSVQIRRGDLFKAMHDSLFVIPNREKVTLGEKLGLSGMATKPTDKILITEVSTNTSSSLQLKFSKAVNYTDKITVEVKRFGYFMDFTKNWNRAQDLLVLSFTGAMPIGVYDIFVNGEEVTSYQTSIKIDQQKIAQVQFPHDRYHLIKVGNTTFGYASYKVLDQFGQTITNSTLTQNLYFAVDAGMASGGAGSVKISGVQDFFIMQPRMITITDPSTGLVQSKSVYPEYKPCTLTGFNFLLKDYEINALNRGIRIDLPYIAYDSFGNETKSYELISSGLVDMDYRGEGDTTIQLTPAGVTDFSLEVAQNPINPSEAVIRLIPSPIPPVADQLYIARAALRAGGIETYMNISVKK